MNKDFIIDIIFLIGTISLSCLFIAFFVYSILFLYEVLMNNKIFFDSVFNAKFDKRINKLTDKQIDDYCDSLKKRYKSRYQSNIKTN